MFVPHGFIVTGTDTGIGKTVFAAALASALKAEYWKPVQAGLDGETDSQAVLRLSGLPESHILPEAYKLKRPASPHIAAAEDGVEIQADTLALPPHDRLIVEGAGGLFVPLSDTLLQIELFRVWTLPIILCARTALGTINHTLLSLEALAARHMPVYGVAFIGAAEPQVEETIVRFGGARRLGRLPVIDPLTPETLTHTFAQHFDISSFRNKD